MINVTAAQKKKLYVSFICVCGILVFLFQDIVTATKEIVASNHWMVVIVLIATIILSNLYKIVLPPDGNSLAMDSSIYLASMFIFGLDITLLLLVCIIFYDIKQRIDAWWVQLFNLATFVLTITGSYHLFVATGGEVGYIHIESAFSYILALVGYFTINIAIIVIYFLIASSNRLFPVLKEMVKESILNYLLIYAFAFILALLLESNKIFGVIIFSIIVVFLSLICGKYFKLYAETLNDKKYIEQIMDTLPVGIVTWNEKLDTLTLSASARNIFNKAEEEVKRIILDHDQDRTENDKFWDLFKKKEESHNVKMIYHSGFKTHTLLISQLDLVNHSAKVVGSIWQIVDITDREELEIKVIQSEKLAHLGELSAGAAHEIRNPLTVIKGFLTLIKDSFSEADNRKFQIPFLLNEIQRMNMIVEDMLSLARPRQPKRKMENIRTIVNEITENYQTSSSTKKIEFDVNIVDCKLMIDVKQMKQVMYNLLRNSVDAIENQGTISIYSKREQNCYQLFIQDTGTGILEDQQKTIFDPFLTSKEMGTGLGLTIVQRIIDKHNGKIELYDSSDKGTTFLISLPVE